MTKSTLVVLLLSLLPWHVSAAPEADKKAVTQAVERFYDQYTQVEKHQAFVKQSKLLTPEFKAAYTKLMNGEFVGADPIIQAQDDLPSSVKAAMVTIEGERAVATMKLSKPNEYTQNWKVTVHLVRRAGAWLINGVDNLQGK